MAWINAQFDPTLDWADVEQIRKKWSGKLVLKGINDPEDAKRALATGADALIVSNHGGRALDGGISSIAALVDVVDAVGGKIEIYMDGGIRTGQDVLKALAVGAKGTFIGRAFNYGLGAMGERGVTEVLNILRKELDMTMGLCGIREAKRIDRSNIILPDKF